MLFFTAYGAFPAEQNACLSCHREHDSVKGKCVSCHRGDDRTRRKKIAHYNLVPGRFIQYTLPKSPVVEEGKKLLEQLACQRCHSCEDKGKRLAVSLDSVGMERNAMELFQSIKSPVLFMPDFHLEDGQIAALVNVFLVRARVQKAPEKETPAVIHFQGGQNMRKNVFVEQCGKCHKMLGETSGGSGSGDIGPNLSGLFSEFYPRTFRDVESWDPKKLKKWLGNPREIRENAQMQPVRLSPEQFKQLLEIMLCKPPDFDPL
jgi:cytochrome c2